MTRIDRREFVQRSSLTCGLAAAPAWMAGAFGNPGPQDPAKPKADSREVHLRAARRRAAARGKPLLVFVVPKDVSERRSRGHRLGGFLNHGGPDTLVDLALCEPACASIDEVREVLGIAPIRSEPLMLLCGPRGLDGKSVPGTVAIDAVFPEAPKLVGIRDYQERMRLEDEHTKACNKQIAAAVHAAVAPDKAALAERADGTRDTFARDERGALERFIAGGVAASDDVLFHGAAVVRMAAEAPRREGDRERLLDALADAAKNVLVTTHVPGAKWARSAGCGTTIEGERGPRVACGMGHVPKLCERFLLFLTE